MPKAKTQTEGEGVVLEWSYGDRIRKARRYAGFSSAELAKRLGLSPATTAYWESTGANPKDIIKMSREIAQLTGVSFTWILLGEDGRKIDRKCGPASLPQFPLLLAA